MKLDMTPNIRDWDNKYLPIYRVTQCTLLFLLISKKKISIAFVIGRFRLQFNCSILVHLNLPCRPKCPFYLVDMMLLIAAQRHIPIMLIWWTCIAIKFKYCHRFIALEPSDLFMFCISHAKQLGTRQLLKNLSIFLCRMKDKSKRRSFSTWISSQCKSVKYHFRIKSWVPFLKCGGALEGSCKDLRPLL